MPQRSVSFLPPGWQENGPYALHHRHCSMKKARATLDRVLSKAGIASRTSTSEWIEDGRVKVNGRVIRNPDHWVETVKDVVKINGLKIREYKKIYLEINNSGSVVTSLAYNR